MGTSCAFGERSAAHNTSDEHQHDRITVTRNGRRAAVSMSADDLAALEDTLDLLSDPMAMADIVQARQEVANGHTVSADQ